MWLFMRALGELEADMAAARAALLRLDQRQVHGVGDEIRLHQQALLLALVGEIVRLAVEAALEVVRRVEDEFGLLEDVDQRRQVGDRDEARRLGARAVEMLVMGVERNTEDRAGPPFEAGLVARVVPHRWSSRGPTGSGSSPRKAGAAARASCPAGSPSHSSRSRCARHRG